MPAPMRKPNLEDLCQALKSIDEPSFTVGTAQSPSMSGNINFKQENYEHNSSYLTPFVKQETEDNMSQFTARSTQTPVIVSNWNSSVSQLPKDSDYDTESWTSDADDDELIMPRVSP